MLKSLPDLICAPKKSGPSRHQLLEENQTLKELIVDLQNRTDNANDHCERLKTAVDTMAKQNCQLNVNLKQSHENVKKTVNDLSSRNSELVRINQILEKTKDQLETESQQLRNTSVTLTEQVTGLEGEVGRLREHLNTFNEITTAFGGKVADIEEGLFRCYYEYRAENRALHHNNLLHIFLQFDRDRDGVLNPTEFARFNDYVESIYGQKIEWVGDTFTTHNLGRIAAPKPPLLMSP